MAQATRTVTAAKLSSVQPNPLPAAGDKLISVIYSDNSIESTTQNQVNRNADALANQETQMAVNIANNAELQKAVMGVDTN